MLHAARPIAVAVAIVGLLAAGTAAAADKRAKVDTLLEVSGTTKATTQMVAALLPQLLALMRQAVPGAPPAVMEAFEQELTQELAASTPEVMDGLAELYARNFTEQEIDALLRFWRSPTGRKLAQTTPRITMESLQIGRDWGQRAAVRAFDRVQRRAQEGAL